MMPADEEAAFERAEEAAFWCVRLAASPLDQASQDAFDAWIAADPANAAAFEEVVVLWQGVDWVKDAPEMIAHRAEAVESLRRTNERRWSRGPAPRRPWVAALAACFAMIFVLGIQIFGHPVQVYETGIGERRIATLEDGTRLTMDGATRVEVRMDADRRRLTLVNGRAKFDVAHDPLRPLSVLARNRLTVATGTSFSVELLPRQMRVVLYEGKVEVMAQADRGRETSLLTRTASADADAALVPGKELVASTEGTQVRVAKTDVARSLDWENGQLSFEGEPLALAVERINRSAKEKLVIADSAIANYRIVGTFNAGDTEAFLEGVAALHPVHIDRQPGMLLLRRGG
ncbi:iron dicitrate transport regulator FecR [Sphingomonas fennica]|uniref:Iron dicitrate transport regulator FecR n=2 Tax=Edaphosphingomonas fennica TaxID=114404 RepID=A0A2T4HRV7_9SPHN|nr:FecR domain-containing protein [Sphingomonas sp. MM-1]PTD18543.1 iron dicitrate transport regulator FecR [Sphingomonas fennica]